MREVARSEPTFRRRLLYASLLFTTLFIADLFVLGALAFSDLSHRMIDQAFRASLAAIDPTLVDPLDGEESEPTAAPPIENCPPASPQSPARSAPCLVAPRRADNVPQVFRSLRYRWQRVVTDTHGRVLWRGGGEGSRTEASHDPRGAPSAPAVPWHPKGEWEVGDGRQEVIAVRQDPGPGGDLVREIGISRAAIEEELAQIERDLQLKLWIGAAVAVVILLVAFLYVLRLLHRTRLLEAQAQMDDRLAYVGALAAGLAHEIRNPLNVLSMNLQMLEEEVERGGAPTDEARLFMGALQGEIRRLSNLVNNFLTYARPNQPRFESRDLNRVLREICQLLRPEFDTKKLTLRTDLSPYLPPVDMDDAQIRQAVMNILHNAAQILKPGGTVTVETRVGPQGEAIIAIQDDGPGIRPEDHERIFEVFYSGRGGGTGLGLPIAARIMEAHGGTIRVESAPGRGARFVLTLPRRHAPGAAPSAASALAAPERPRAGRPRARPLATARPAPAAPRSCAAPSGTTASATTSTPLPRSPTPSTTPSNASCATSRRRIPSWSRPTRRRSGSAPRSPGRFPPRRTRCRCSASTTPSRSTKCASGTAGCCGSSAATRCR